jgi:hypothetical protein
MTKISLIYEFEDEKQLRAHLDGQTRSSPAVTVTASEPVPTLAAEPAAEPADVVRSASDLDGDGMPYDASVHADPPSFTKDGTWRAKRGKSDEANAARAAFKARGGAVTPPADILPPPGPAAVAPPAAAPVLPPAVAAPAAPALPPSMPEPVELTALYRVITNAAQNRLVDTGALYDEFCNTRNPGEVGLLLNNDETLRRRMYDRLIALGARDAG